MRAARAVSRFSFGAAFQPCGYVLANAACEGMPKGDFDRCRRPLPKLVAILDYENPYLEAKVESAGPTACGLIIGPPLRVPSILHINAVAGPIRLRHTGQPPSSAAGRQSTPSLPPPSSATGTRRQSDYKDYRFSSARLTFPSASWDVAG